MKTRIVALLLAWFCGLLGFHDYYLNRNLAGQIKIVICLLSFFFSISEFEFLNVVSVIGFAGVILWTLIDFFNLTGMTDEKFNELYNK